MNLLERGLPKLLDHDFQSRTKTGRALRWFMGWQDMPGVEFKLINVWIPLEMLTVAYWQDTPGKPKHILPRVRRFLGDLGIPTLSEVPLQRFYDARNAIVHGEVDRAEAMMSAWFGGYVAARREQLRNPHREET